MAEPRQYPGERLVERLFARGERRVRVGVSSAFFARFGLENPWDLDAPSEGWGFGGQRGVLGAFQSLFERRLLGHLAGGVLFRGSLGLSLDHPWADWLPFLLQARGGGLWRDRRLAALARLPGSGLGRPRSPWGAYTSPAFSYLLPELEELEPEQEHSVARFRRRSRRARRGVSDAPAALPPRAAAGPLPTFVGSRAPAVRPVAAAAASTTFPRRPSALPVPSGPRGVARAMSRATGPVGASPAAHRAMDSLRAEPPGLRSALEVLPAPALAAPMAWAEARLRQASAATSTGVVTSPVPRPGEPPVARRHLAPLFFSSPTLSFVAPEPEQDLDFEPQPGARPRPRTSQAPARAVSRPPRATEATVVRPLAPPRFAAGAEAPSAQPGDASSAPVTEQRPAPRRKASALAAERLVQIEGGSQPPAAAQPYRALRRALPDRQLQAVERPIARAIARAPAADSQLAPSRVATQAPRALDHLLVRPSASPGLPGRIQRAVRATDVLATAAPVAARGLSAAVVRSAHSAGPRRLGSPMLAFLEQAEAAPVEPLEPGTAVAPHRRRRSPQAAARALLRAEPAADGGSVLPSPVRRAGPQALAPLSEAAFPGRSQRRRRAVDEAVGTTRSMRVPWLPMDRLVEPEAPAPDQQPASAPRAASRRPAPAVAARPAPARPVPARPALAASARAVARLAEVTPPAAPAAPTVRARADGSPVAAATRPRSEAARPGPRPSARRAPPQALPVSDGGPTPPPAQGPLLTRQASVTERDRAPAAAPSPRVVAAARPAPAAAERPSGTQRALHRLGGPATTTAGTPASVQLSPVHSPRAWAFARAPSTVWLQWRDIQPGDDPTAVPVIRRAGAVAPPMAPPMAPPQAAPHAQRWAPASSAAAAVMRSPAAPSAAPGSLRPGPASSTLGVPAAPVLPGQRQVAPSAALAAAGPAVSAPPAARRLDAPAGSPRALPSGRALGRLAARSRVQQRALAVAGGLDVLPSAAGAAPSVHELAPAAGPGGPTARARPSRRGPVARTPSDQADAIARAPSAAARLSAIDSLLAGGVGAQALLPALARIDKPDEVLRIVLERTLGWRGRGTLPAPVRQLVEQVQAAAETPEQQPRRRPQAAPRRAALRRRPPAARRSATSAAPTKAAATVHHVQADHRIRGLVKKLEQLIHLVDVEHRLAAARSQVRMAEDSPAARQPGSPDASPEASANQAGQDVDSLVQLIVEVVNEEMSMYSLRRPEDPNDRTPWF
jgi:hypothetical protein